MEKYKLYRNDSNKLNDNVKVVRIFSVGNDFKTPDNPPIELKKNSEYYIADPKFKLPPFSKDEITYMPEKPASVQAFGSDDYQRYNINNDSKTPVTNENIKMREEAVAQREQFLLEKENDAKLLYWQNHQAIQQSNEEMNKLTKSINNSNKQFQALWFGESTTPESYNDMTDDDVKNLKPNVLKAAALEYISRTNLQE